ncbi:MAG: marine proteobacterial sortase target protein [Pseudomonadota bacterium]
MVAPYYPTSGAAELRRPFVSYLLAATAFAAATICAPMAFGDTPADADWRLQDGFVTKGEVSSGALLIETTLPGKYVEAPLVAGNVDMSISGPVIRSRVTQRFTNPTDEWVEGVYAFPLPEDAAVDTLKIIIGDRFIEGNIKERQEARRIYEEAKAQGVRAGLVEQERPNLFTTSVANIGPGETVAIQIEYQDKAQLTDGTWSTRFPLVVAPRYSPPPELGLLASRGSGEAPDTIAIIDPVPDRDAITPPVLHPITEPTEGLRLPVAINIKLDAGFSIGEVRSGSHALELDKRDEDTIWVSLADGDVPADRDFTLTWSAAAGNMPNAGLFYDTRGEETYVFAFVTPPEGLGASAPRQDRETIFVIDNSGSMSGESMEQAKAGLLMGLDRLIPEDEFNIVRFDDTYELVFPDAVPATPENVTAAKLFVRNLQADGGTEMLPALRAALIDRDGANSDEVRQVVFITDGAIGNETELFEAINTSLGRSRLFTVGIGSAPNSYFMTRASRMGRGTFTYIDDISEVAEQSSRLFSALERPVMVDLSATFPQGANPVMYPAPLPDLYQCEPVTLVAKVDDLDGEITLAGKLSGADWTARLPLDKAAPGPGAAQLWARAKIADIEESRFDGVDWEQVDSQVLKTALDYNLVSRLTSLVAVDVTPARPAGETLDTRRIATMLPKGWEFVGVFGQEADIRAAAFDKLPPEILAAVAKQRAAGSDEGPQDGLQLPQTAAGWEVFALIGIALLAFGAVAFGRRPSRDRKKDQSAL